MSQRKTEHNKYNTMNMSQAQEQIIYITDNKKLKNGNRKRTTTFNRTTWEK